MDTRTQQLAKLPIRLFFSTVVTLLYPLCKLADWALPGEPVYGTLRQELAPIWHDPTR